MTDHPQHPDHPAKAKVFVSLAYLVAIGGICLAFLPMGFGFVTAFAAIIGVSFAGMATRNGATHSGRWAARANMVPVLVYVTYMAAHMPSEDRVHTAQATVIESGVLADQQVFDEKTRASGDIQGLRLSVAPCGQEFVVRVTGRPNSHLGLYVPAKETRTCLSTIQTGEQIEMELTTTTGTVFEEVKGFRIKRISRCTFTEVDNGALVKGMACPEWLTEEH